MLTIRREQMTIFSREAAKGFEARLYAHLARAFPEECQELGEEIVRQTIRQGNAAAGHYGIFSELDVARYVGMMFILGVDFDKDPQMPWATRILNDLSTESDVKMDELSDHVRRHLEQEAALKVRH